MLSVTADKPTPICIKSIEATKMDLLLQNSSTVNVMTTSNTSWCPLNRGLKHVLEHFLPLCVFRVKTFCHSCASLATAAFIRLQQVALSATLQLTSMTMYTPYLGKHFPYMLDLIPNFRIYCILLGS